MCIFNDTINLIKKTNGDVLGILLFIIIIFYFANIENRTTYESIILYGSAIALAVDINTVLNVTSQ